MQRTVSGRDSARRDTATRESESAHLRQVALPGANGTIGRHDAGPLGVWPLVDASAEMLDRAYGLIDENTV